MSDYKVAWSDSSLAMFRVLRGEMQKYGFTTGSLYLFLCIIIHQTFIMDEYFRKQHISEDDINRVIHKLYARRCYKATSKLKVQLADDSKCSSYAFETSYVKKQLNAERFVARDFDGSTISLLVDSALFDILIKTAVKAQTEGLELINPKNIIETMFDEDCAELKDFFASLGPSYEEAKEYFTKQYQQDTFSIPEELSGILSVLNDEVDLSKPCEILGREQECNAAWNIMLKKHNHNPLIVGEAGYGKTALVEKLTYDIEAKKSPKQFFGFKVISVDVYALIHEIANCTKYAHMLIDFLTSRSDVIVFIDKIQELTTVQEAGNVDVLSFLDPLFSCEKVIFIGALNKTAYNERFIQYDIANHFEYVELLPVLLNDMYSMLHKKIQSLSEYHGVKISPKMAKFALKMAYHLLSRSEDLGFHHMLNLIDMSLATANRMGISSVTRSEILQNCHLSYFMWDSMSQAEKRNNSIHEVGHYIVLTECRDILNLSGSAISIVPLGPANGLTFASVDSLALKSYDKNYYISYIAFLLAGKVAEDLFGIKPNSGAISDLSRVTEQAIEAVEILDLLGIHHRNELYINSKESLSLSDESAELVNQKALELINLATERAQNILEANKDVIEAISNALLKNPVMIDEDIERVWRKTIRKRSKASEDATINNANTIDA